MFVPVSTILVRSVAIVLGERCTSGSGSGLGATPLFLSKNCPERECLSHSPPSVPGVAPSPPAARWIPAGRQLRDEGATGAPVLVERHEDRAAHTYAAMAPDRPSAPRRVRKPPRRPASRIEGRRAVGEDRHLTGWRNGDDTWFTSPAYRPAAPAAPPAPVP